MDKIKQGRHFLFSKYSLILLCTLLSVNAISETFQLGDVAPRSAPDGQLNAADSLILQQMILGNILPTNDEIKLGDVAPLGNVDGVLDAGDLIVQQRAVLGLINLGTVDVLPSAPTLIDIDPLTAELTTQNPFQISGTATPSTNINIYVQNTLQHQLVSEADGTFSVNIYLYDGVNNVYATEFDGIDVSSASNVLQVQYDNVINRNSLPANITEDTVLTPGIIPQPYIISSNLTIDEGVSFIVQPGAELRFEAGLSLVVNGKLIINGTAQNRAIFISSQVQPVTGSWAGIEVEGGGVVIIDYVVIEHAINGLYFKAGSDGSVSNSTIRYNGDGVEIQGASSPTIGSGNVITENTNGIHLVGKEEVNPTASISNNQIYSNVTYNVFADSFTGGMNNVVNVRRNYWGNVDFNLIILKIRSPLTSPTIYPTIDFGEYLNVNGEVVIGRKIFSGLVTTTLEANTEYNVLGNIEIPEGEVLIIPEGVNLYFPVNGKLNVNGTLIAQGTALSPVIFTKQSIDYWKGVIVSGPVASVNLHHVRIENAVIGVSVSGSDIVINESVVQNNSTGIGITNANGLITNSLIQKNNTGIYLSNASPVIQSNQIIDNVTFGISMYQQSSPLVNSNNTIRGGAHGFYLVGNSASSIYPLPIVNGNQIFGASIDVFATSYVYTGLVPKVNFHDNWWGTTNVGLISEKISDASDGSGNKPLIDFTGHLSSVGGEPVQGSFLPGGSISDAQVGGSGLVENTVYQVLGGLTVPVGGILTIPEGVQLQFPKDAKLDIYGVLKVEGTALSPVVLTSSGENSWAGIKVNGSATGLNINHAIIENSVTGVTITGSDGVISNSVIQKNQQGISLSASNGLISNNIIQTSNTGLILINASPIIQGNQIVNNVSFAIHLLQQSSPVVTDNVIRDNGNGFVMSGNTTVGNYPQPTVNNNHIDNSTNVSANSYYFIGAAPQINFQNNWWSSVNLFAIGAKINDYIDNPSLRPIIDYSNMLSVANGNVIPVTYLLGGDRFDALSEGNGLLAGTTYHVLGDITVPVNETLTIPAGVKFHFFKNSRLDVYGTLVVQGGIDSPVIFTSNKETPAMSDWLGITVRSDANVIIDYAIVEYANLAIQFLSGSSGVVRHSILSNSIYGIYITGLSSPLIDSNTMVNNQYGIFIVGSSGNPDPTIINNDIYENVVKNLHLSSVTSTVPLNISGNWWGADDVSTVRASISGVNNDALVLLDNIATTENNSAALIDFEISNLYISPVSSTNVKDTTLITAVLSKSENWFIEIRNEAAQVVKTASGAGTLISFQWNGENNVLAPLPDGRYQLVIHVDGATVKTSSIVIDNTLPVSIISSPVENAIFTVINAMDITGVANDANIEGYTIEAANSHAPVESDYQLLTSAQLVTTSSLFSWLYSDNGGVQEYGDKTIRLSVFDKAGNRSIVTVPIRLDYLAIRNVSLSSDIINTQNGDSVNIHFTLEQPAEVVLRIYNELENKFGPPDGILPNGLVLGTNLVKEKTETFSTAGNYSINWDGFDNNGKVVPQDAYRFELIATTGSESNSYAAIPALNKFSGIAQAVDYANYSFYKNEYITLTVTVPPSAIVRLFMKATSNLNPANNISAINKVVDEGDYLFLIDGRDDEGKIVNTANIISTGAAAIYQKDSKSIFVKSPSLPVLRGTESYPDIEIKSNPYRIKYSYDQISSIAFTVNEDAYVSVDIMEQCFFGDLTCSANVPTGSVLNIMDSELLTGDDGSGAVVHSFEWHGYDFESVNVDTNNILTDEEGYYTFRIKAISASTGLETIYRGSLLLYR